MCRIIDSELVIGNILIELLEKDITKINVSLIEEFEEKLSSMIKVQEYYTTINALEISKFEESYSFFITAYHDEIMLNDKILKEKERGIARLNSYFRFGVPTFLKDSIKSVSEQLLVGTAK